jgi:putative transposase
MVQGSQEVIAALDFFTVPTLTFRVLYCLFVIEHGRRRILHFKHHGASDQRMERTAIARGFPAAQSLSLCCARPRCQIQSGGLGHVRSEWNRTDPNEYSKSLERWVGSCRREMVDHIIPRNEDHLRRLGREYLACYHGDRTHRGLGSKRQ